MSLVWALSWLCFLSPSLLFFNKCASGYCTLIKKAELTASSRKYVQCIMLCKVKKHLEALISAWKLSIGKHVTLSEGDIWN